MGLDITAYSKMQKLDAVFDADGEPIDPKTREPLDWKTYTQIRINYDFQGRADDLEDKACYTYGEVFKFRAGSYGGYNAWRERLAELADYPQEPYQAYEALPPRLRRDAAAWAGKAEGMPFVELINFSDCEGVIGSEVSAKLAKDFSEWDERAKTVSDMPWFYEAFTNWRRAFELASDGGCVRFH